MGCTVLLLGLNYELVLKQFSITPAGIITNLALPLGTSAYRGQVPFYSILFQFLLLSMSTQQHTKWLPGLIQHYRICHGNQASVSDGSALPLFAESFELGDDLELGFLFLFFGHGNTRKLQAEQWQFQHAKVPCKAPSKDCFLKLFFLSLFK